MRFKVNLQKNGKSLENGKRLNAGNFLRNIKIRMDVLYWGLSPALKHQPLSRVSLNGRYVKESKGSAGYELDLFTNRVTDVFGILKSKYASAGVGLAAILAFIGAGTTEAKAVSYESVNIQQASGDSVKAKNAVVTTGGAYAGLESYIPGSFERAPVNLAYWHNNTGTHTNNSHNNSNTHSNAAWSNRSYAHSNTDWDNRSVAHSNNWTNTPHSNLPPVTHTNVSGGSVPNEYLY